MVEYISINGAKLAYRLAGPKNAPLIITLHGGRGFGNHESDFKAFIPLSSTYRVFSFDFRGHGESLHTEPYSFHQIVEDIDAIRRHFLGDASPCILLGGSFGGFVAQQYAITYPSNVSHLILRGTAPSHHHEESAIKTLEERTHRAPGLSISMLRDKIFGHFESNIEFRLVMHAAAPLYAESFDAEFALKRNLETAFNAKAHNDLYSNSEKFFDYRERLGSITAKTLVLVGENDWICPLEQSRDIVSRIPGARLEVLERANHAVHLERNEEVINIIRNHISK